MTDEGLEQPMEGADNAHEQDTPPFPVPWAQGAQTPPAPPVPPPPPHGSYSAPEQQTPPFPMPWVQGAPPPPAPPVPPPPAQGPPYSSYALGALAGNPNLGAPAGGGYGGPPSPPYVAWTPSAEPPAQPSQGGRKHIGALIGAAAAVVALGCRRRYRPRRLDGQFDACLLVGVARHQSVGRFGLVRFPGLLRFVGLRFVGLRFVGLRFVGLRFVGLFRLLGRFGPE